MNNVNGVGGARGIFPSKPSGPPVTDWKQQICRLQTLDFQHFQWQIFDGYISNFNDWILYSIGIRAYLLVYLGF